jgi:hypothetical protein
MIMYDMSAKPAHGVSSGDQGQGAPGHVFLEVDRHQIQEEIYYIAFIYKEINA